MNYSYLLIIVSSFFCHKLVSQNNTVQIYNPFDIHVDPMECLLLVNFDNDPDSLYIGFEPQQFDDALNGKGFLVLGWRNDGRVDVYHEAGLALDPSKYSIAGKGLANMLEREFTNSLMQITETGVKAFFKFSDINNREIIISIEENNHKKTKPFGLLAPMGDAVENPSSMPLVMLQDFYFVRQKYSKIHLSINGRQHTIDNLPLPIDRTKMTFIRYSPKPLIATFNPEFSGTLSSINIERNQKNIETENYQINFEWNADKAYMKSITKKNEIHPINISFKNAFPNLADIENNAAYKGTFQIESHPSIGKVKGKYNIANIDNQITISLIPSKGWVPKKSKFSLMFLYTVAKVFKKWPTTYEWTATISKAENQYFMESQWTRNNR